MYVCIKAELRHPIEVGILAETFIYIYIHPCYLNGLIYSSGPQKPPSGSAPDTDMCIPIYE